MALAMLRVLHVAAMTFASGQFELSTSKSPSQEERSANVDVLAQYKQGNARYICERDRMPCGHDRGFPLLWVTRSVM